MTNGARGRLRSSNTPTIHPWRVEGLFSRRPLRWPARSVEPSSSPTSPEIPPTPPYTDPGASLGPLQACGDPRCHLESEKRWLRKDGTFHAFCLKYFDDLAIKGGAKAPDLKPKLVKLGER